MIIGVLNGKGCSAPSSRHQRSKCQRSFDITEYQIIQVYQTAPNRQSSHIMLQFLFLTFLLSGLIACHGDGQQILASEPLETKDPLVPIFQSACDASCCGSTAAPQSMTQKSSLPCCPTCTNLIDLHDFGIPFSVVISKHHFNFQALYAWLRD